MRTYISALFALALVFGSCAEAPPSAFDGNGRLLLTAVWDSSGGSVPGAPLVPMAFAKVILTSEYGTMIRQTDTAGVLRLENLPATTYSFSVRKPHPEDPSIQIVGSMLSVLVQSGSTTSQTIQGKPISSSGVTINEIYCGGPVNGIFFFYDQFIELYNASDSVRYLDGAFVMRVTGSSDLHIEAGEDYDNDGDIDGVTYVFRFPGIPGESNHPIHPGQFMVLAGDGVNHSAVVPGAVDLSHADWEFYNQYSPEDIDNPSVANLINDRTDRTVHFLNRLTGDDVVVSAGRDSNWIDGIDISDIIDGVEYQDSTPPALRKKLDNRVDRGFVLSPPKYSGKSMQRREPGTDTNEGTIDWEILNAATPGRQ